MDQDTAGLAADMPELADFDVDCLLSDIEWEDEVRAYDELWELELG